MSNSKNVQKIADFTKSTEDISSWAEQSDSAKSNGNSKAVLVIQKTKLVQRAILFTLLNSKPNGQSGPCFASVNCEINIDLSEFRAIAIKCRGQGANLHYKLLLKHDGIGKDAVIHGQTFMAPAEFAVIKLPLAKFKPYFRAHQLDSNSYNLDTTSINHIGIKIDNGSYLPENQLGVSVLEIDWIKAVK